MSQRVHRYDVLESTNTEAERLAMAGATHGTVVVADRQTAGRGRAGRSWFSPSNGNVYLSIIWELDWPVERIPQVTLQVAIAVARCVSRLGGEARVDWPNDVVVDGRKVAGVLTQLIVREGAPPAVVVGVGLDIRPLGEDAPDDVRAVAGHVPTEATRDEAADVLVECLDEAYADLKVRGAFDWDTWRRNSRTLGRRVRVMLPGEPAWEGVATDLDPSGALVVARDGEPVTVVAGDVRLVPEVV